MSKKTVSAVVNNMGGVSEHTRERVRSAIVELGFQPNPAARRLSSGLTGSITLAIGHLGSAETAELAAAVIAAAERVNLGVTCLPTNGPTTEAPGLAPGTSDGLLLVPARRSVVLPTRTPIVLMGTRSLDCAADQIVAPLDRLLRQAERLLAHNGPPVVLIGADNDDLLPADFARVLATDSSASAGYTAVMERWQTSRARAGQADTMVAVGSALAIGAVHALRDLGVAIPHDVRLVAIGSGVEAAFAYPSITTVSPDLDVMASRSIERLRSRIAGDTQPPQHIHIPFIVTRRESTNVQ